MSKKLVALDFDGVIHSYVSGWKGDTNIPDLPHTGAFEWITAAIKRFEVAVYSSRSRTHDGRMAMIEWFRLNGMDPDVLQQIDFPATKPAAWLTIDDRCLCFTGDWPTLDSIDEFQPWYQGEFATEGGQGASGEDNEPPGVSVGLDEDGQLIFEFTKAIKWVGFSKDQALRLAAKVVEIVEHSEADGK